MLSTGLHLASESSEGRAYEGSNKYIMRFEKCRTPPADRPAPVDWSKANFSSWLAPGLSADPMWSISPRRAPGLESCPPLPVCRAGSALPV